MNRQDHTTGPRRQKRRAGAFALAALVVTAATQAAATNVTEQTCATVGIGFEVPTVPSTSLRIVLAEGDELEMRISDGYYYKDGVYTPYYITGSAIFIVTEGQAGTYWVNRSQPDTPLSVDCYVGGRELTSLGDLQADLTPIIITGQAARMAAAVSRNADGALGGKGGAQVTNSGFFFQTAGLAAKVDPDAPQITASTMGTASDWNAWMMGSYNRIDGAGDTFDGSKSDLLAGVDYRIAPDQILGVMLGLGRVDFNLLVESTAGTFDSNGQTIGTYWAMRSASGLKAEALLAYTRSSYDVALGTTTGSFDANRLTVAGSLHGTIQRGGFTIEPGATLVYGIERQAAYTNSADGDVDGQTVRAGRLSVGPKVWLPVQSGAGGQMMPWLGVHVEHDFSNAASEPVSGMPAMNNRTSLRLSGGVDVAMANGGALSFDVQVGGLGNSKVRDYGMGLSFAMPF